MMDIEEKLYLNRYIVDHESHLKIRDPKICSEDCMDKPCTYTCPAQVYSWEDNRIRVAYEGCVECGTCRYSCPPDNIQWSYPRGGYGVMWKFG